MIIQDCLFCGDRKPLLDWYYCSACRGKMIEDFGESYRDLAFVKALIQDEKRRRYREGLAWDREEPLDMSKDGDVPGQADPPPDFEHLVATLWFDSGRVLSGAEMFRILSHEGQPISRRSVYTYLARLIEQHGKPTKARDELYWTVRRIMEARGDSESGAAVNVRVLLLGMKPKIQDVYDRMSAVRVDWVLEEHKRGLRVPSTDLCEFCSNIVLKSY
jgi:hypothetical protein